MVGLVRQSPNLDLKSEWILHGGHTISTGHSELLNVLFQLYGARNSSSQCGDVSDVLNLFYVRGSRALWTMVWHFMAVASIHLGRQLPPGHLLSFSKHLTTARRQIARQQECAGLSSS